MTQPLLGIRIVELAGLAPAPFAAMMLADHGAEVVRVERAGWTHPIPPDKDILRRSRADILTLDLKQAGDAAKLRELARGADGLIEGFRHDVVELLGLGPKLLCAENPRQVYGRMTGFGQDGPLSSRRSEPARQAAAPRRAGQRPVSGCRLPVRMPKFGGQRSPHPRIMLGLIEAIGVGSGRDAGAGPLIAARFAGSP